MRLHEILSEDVNDNLLYHSVGSGLKAEKILQSGEIKPNISRGDQSIQKFPVISCSRSQYARYGGPAAAGSVQFVIDKDKLRDHGYKISPSVGVGMGYKDEREERVWHPRGIGIPINDTFIREIQIDPHIDIPDEFILIAKEKNIKLTTFKKKKGDVPRGQPRNRIISTKIDRKDFNASKIKIAGSGITGHFNIYYGKDPVITDVKSKDMAVKLAAEMKRRIENGLPLDDLQALMITKSWKSPSYMSPVPSEYYNKILSRSAD